MVEAIERAGFAVPLQTLAHAVGLSPAYLQRRFRHRFGVSPAEYARARMALQGYAAQQLGRPLLPVPPQARPPSPAQPAPATPQSSSLVNR